MRIPHPPKPPDFYWKIPLVWRRRYCRWFVNPWWNVYRFAKDYLTWRYFTKTLPEVLSFRKYCFMADMRDFISRRNERSALKKGVIRFKAFVFAFRNMKIYKMPGQLI